MRRVLKKVAREDFENFGDVSTLAEPSSVEQIVQAYRCEGSHLQKHCFYRDAQVATSAKRQQV